MRIGIFGGSFDPVHIEHIRLAKQAVEELALDKLYIMPAHVPPHKAGKTLSPDMDRLNMCRLAFADVKNTEVSDYECQREGTSYTYLTCRHFKAEFPAAEIFWLVGTDMLRDFPTWRDPEDILSNVTLAVCGRNETGAWVQQEQERFFQKFSKKFAYLSYNGANVSSTKLRVLGGAGVRLTDFTHEKVAKYIEGNGLYKIKGAKEALSLEKEERRLHSIRVAELAASRAPKLKIPENQAIAAALFHDCAKNLPSDSPYLEGFALPNTWGEVPKAVVHQFAGAYVAEKYFGVQNEDIVNAIRYHTSGRENMSDLEKLIFLADMLEEERSYEGVEELRTLFWEGNSLDECLKQALRETILFIEKKGATVYPLTLLAYKFINHGG